MRLIDADKLIDRFKELKGSDTLAMMFVRDVIKEIRKQPTAYDVDKVVGRLDGEIFLTTDDDGNTNDFSIRAMEADEVMKIVKFGGIE